MSELSHTPGPWRWELNEKHKTVTLCGGKPRFDKSVMQFSRYGMSGAAPRFRNAKCVMERAEAFGIPQPGREHHADWFKLVSHPDANLIEAAPEMFEALRALIDLYVCNEGTAHEFIACITPPHASTMDSKKRKESKTWAAWDMARAAIAKAHPTTSAAGE